MKEAMFYERVKGGKVNCNLCARYCRNIADGKTGFCRVRQNIKGKMYSLVYGKACSVAIDPIEKKPLFHFAPGTSCLSLATVGCNFRCLHCQNWEISQEYGEIYGEDLEPKSLVEIAKNRGVEGIAYTYTEPTVFFEYAFDTMKLAKKAGLYNVWVSNGYTSPPVIKHMAKYLDAVNVDVKGNDEFYKRICIAPGVKPVYDALLAYKKYGVWLEVTNLVIPGYNDKEKDVLELVKWVKKNLSADTPLHFSAFYPQYKITNVPRTPVETLERCSKIARREGMHWVYLGNVYGSEHESTTCWHCGESVIKRVGYNILSCNEKCPHCGKHVPIAGKKWVKGPGGGKKFK